METRTAGRRALVAVVVLVAAACAAPPAPPPPFQGSAAVARPVGSAPPVHPFLADTVSNGMHGDAANTDAHTPVGPLGNATVVDSFDYGGLCVAQAFDTAGRLFTVCGSVQGFTLVVVDPVTMAPLASLALPQRPSTLQAILAGDPSVIFSDTSGGAYFVLDHLGRAVLVDAEQVLRVIALEPRAAGWALVDVARYPLAGHLVERDCFAFPTNLDPVGACDVVTAVMPDWSGRYWFVSRRGVVGTVDPATGEVRTLTLAGEEIENSMAVDDRAVYVVSDHAVYALAADPSGAPGVRWREDYDHSGGPRPGQLALGSGTTPTLVGDDLLAITDGADPVDVVVMRRDDEPDRPRTMCTVPVFGAGASAVENSLVTDGVDVAVQNTWGYEHLFTLPPGMSVPGGVAGVGIDRAAGTCEVQWASAERVPSSAMKLSRGAGLLYGYAKEPDAFGRDIWYWTAIDWRTGATVYRVLAGIGPQWNNNWGVISIGPDGSGYMGTMSGLLRVRDA